MIIIGIFIWALFTGHVWVAFWLMMRWLLLLALAQNDKA
jgi:hypothetical protein